jgi:uncharacterized RDD family membrane protein YckC
MRAFPENRTFWRRVAAGLIDMLVFAPLIWVNVSLWERLPGPVSRLTWFLTYAVVGTAYSTAMHARYGQTLGKMLLRVKVVTMTGTSISWSHAVIRDCVPIVAVAITIATKWPLAIDGTNPYSAAAVDHHTAFDRALESANSLWLYLELITMWTNARRRAVHDFLAGTMVVRLDSIRRDAA